MSRLNQGPEELILLRSGFQPDGSDFAGFAKASSPALLAGGRKWGFLGDSITARTGAAAGRGFIDLVPWIAGTASVAPLAPLSPASGVAFSGNYGVAGERSDQILVRTDAMLADGVAGVSLLAGTNDAGQGVTTATFLANIAAIAAKCRVKGVPLIVGTVPPRASTATAAFNASVAAYNLALRQWAPGAGVYLAGTYAALADITTGYLAAAYDSGDGVHPNTAGHRVLAYAVATAVQRAIPTQAAICIAKSPTSLVTNPTFSAATTGWFEQPGGTGTAPTYSRVADATGRLPTGAQWYEQDFDATAAGGSRSQATQLSAGWSVGDLLLVTAQLDLTDVSGFTAAVNADPNTAASKLQLVNQSGVQLPGNINPPLPLAPGEIAFVIQVPAGTTTINLWLTNTLPTGTHAKFRISCADVRNLTTLGVTNY